MIRLFVGLELPAEIRRQLSFMQGGVQNARWTDEANFHLTLAFIGEVDEGTAEDIDSALIEIHEPAFKLDPAGVGQFDRNGHTRILWAGMRPSQFLNHLQEKITTAFDRHDLPFDRRRFTPHVTLARLNSTASQDRVFTYLADHNLFSAPGFLVESFSLFESVRLGAGPVYLPIKRYPLRRQDS